MWLAHGSTEKRKLLVTRGDTGEKVAQNMWQALVGRGFCAMGQPQRWLPDQQLRAQPPSGTARVTHGPLCCLPRATAPQRGRPEGDLPRHTSGARPEAASRLWD